MRLRFLAFWIRVRLGTEWIANGFREEVPKVLAAFKRSILSQLAGSGQPWIGLSSRIPTELNALLREFDLLPLFAHRPNGQGRGG
ncbi:hypothetical protein MAMC_00673 [Methylacidimicrobium cyclopophantes]|uniref:Uncharacterized protein n=1 Tax=Methylacidimicrobium cyclopophantes TaxID=1041766 RepID=A0A5E6MJ80_9BACT|nr:hypothetical protein [Methylacidimicrobium cyclopophantes]VVM05562.1 hypothetical protein MAMC_00673 [Methylacidimicrobium cyclopophantes]